MVSLRFILKTSVLVSTQGTWSIALAVLHGSQLYDQIRVNLTTPFWNSSVSFCFKVNDDFRQRILDKCLCSILVYTLSYICDKFLKKFVTAGTNRRFC